MPEALFSFPKDGHMANQIPVSQIVAASLGLIEANSVLGNLVYRDAESSFVGGVGDTVRVRVPNVIEAKDGTGAPTEFDSINEGAVPVTLTAEAYNAVKLSDKELTLDIVNFGAQVLQPQASGVAKFCEKTIAGVMNEQVAASTDTIDPANPLAAIARAAAEFTRRELDMSGRTLVIGPDMLEAFLSLPALQDVAAAGADEALRGGELTRLMGFSVRVSPFIDGAIAFTREAFALACRAPATADGAGYAATETNNGYSLRYVRDFDMAQRGDVSLMSVFVGATVLDSRRFMAFNVSAGG
ncbi:P22 phage major capsid protein family protein [Nocardiopsis alba]|uniref:P22 phage major capsid protein family protein n=1 Tax=Nocardiopsis alba TaxID=53437 RepID=UPI00366F82DE